MKALHQGIGPWTNSARGFTPLRGSVLQRKCACGGTPGPTGECEPCRKKKLQRRSENLPDPSSVSEVPPIVHEVLRSPGQPLDAETRAFMEPRFGHDFSSVRVHTDTVAVKSAAAINADAYAVGRHIAFGEDRFSSATREGRSLLAHELAHIVQQRSVRDGASPLEISAPNDATEREAHHIAESAADGRAIGATRRRVCLARATRPFLLTFDDGPDGAHKLGGGNLTEKVLNTLCETGVQAGFFVQTAAPFRGSSTIGETLIKRMSANGHRVAIHTGGTRDHEAHPEALTAGRLTSELSSAKSVITKLTGETPTMVRPPYGTSNKAVRAVYKTLGLTNVLWDIDGDASVRKGKAANLADIKTNITASLKSVIAGSWKGSTPLAPTIVALFHDIRPNTANNVGAIIDFIKSETSALTDGKDTAAFPSISCKPAGTEAEDQLKEEEGLEKPERSLAPPISTYVAPPLIRER